jgi:hypothetical protein
MEEIYLYSPIRLHGVVPRSRMEELYLYSPIRLHGVVLN